MNVERMNIEKMGEDGEDEWRKKNHKTHKNKNVYRSLNHNNKLFPQKNNNII